MSASAFSGEARGASTRIERRARARHANPLAAAPAKIRPSHAKLPSPCAGVFASRCAASDTGARPSDTGDADGWTACGRIGSGCAVGASADGRGCITAAGAAASGTAAGGVVLVVTGGRVARGLAGAGDLAGRPGVATGAGTGTTTGAGAILTGLGLAGAGTTGTDDTGVGGGVVTGGLAGAGVGAIVPSR